MTFLERYQQAESWQDKAMIMEIYHLAMCQRERNWTIAKTAEEFQCSIGLVSENLKLAQRIHNDPTIMKVATRYEAVRKVR